MVLNSRQDDVQPLTGSRTEYCAALNIVLSAKAGKLGP